jgi:siroheme synthase (precorrin-2 oxidase/ferrochelatase)
MPWFYKFTDMEDGELKTRVFKEAEKTKIPVS